VLVSRRYGYRTAIPRHPGARIAKRWREPCWHFRPSQKCATTSAFWSACTALSVKRSGSPGPTPTPISFSQVAHRPARAKPFTAAAVMALPPARPRTGNEGTPRECDERLFWILLRDEPEPGFPKWPPDAAPPHPASPNNRNKDVARCRSRRSRRQPIEARVRAPPLSESFRVFQRAKVRPGRAKCRSPDCCGKAGSANAMG